MCKSAANSNRRSEAIITISATCHHPPLRELHEADGLQVQGSEPCVMPCRSHRCRGSWRRPPARCTPRRLPCGARKAEALGRPLGHSSLGVLCCQAASGPLRLCCCQTARINMNQQWNSWLHLHHVILITLADASMHPRATDGAEHLIWLCYGPSEAQKEGELAEMRMQRSSWLAARSKGDAGGGRAGGQCLERLSWLAARAQGGAAGMRASGGAHAAPAVPNFGL